jgi:hypothetical protein
MGTPVTSSRKRNTMARTLVVATTIVCALGLAGATAWGTPYFGPEDRSAGSWYVGGYNNHSSNEAYNNGGAWGPLLKVEEYHNTYGFIFQVQARGDAFTSHSASYTQVWCSVQDSNHALLWCIQT